MKKTIHTADSRGQANHGWLKSAHSFSFANYHDPERMGFGVLRVLNDDHVAAGMGFGTHGHSNMEIISIPLKGDLEHQDNMGNTTIIREGDIQVMSAGTGVQHSEHNHSKEEAVEFLQIWVIPNKANVSPRYDQISLEQIAVENELYQILSPHQDDDGVWIHQDAWFHLGQFDSAKKFHYHLKKSGNGVYIFILEGEGTIAGEKLMARDAIGIEGTDAVAFEVNTGTRLLVMEIPMTN
ncbi:pirin family protein [Aggregatimonas sangjinii]|uniref:Pirin family protein n=1 Tax=Aggregatimonas sangjinii TaxID=2583587 RepID=A0A5B7SX79_9FLAO|nr:pirin family protein [Aggregatimonas sangjinii]QCX01334.1 pirin family protein [Aggregatimonas sangjinii]